MVAEARSAPPSEAWEKISPSIPSCLKQTPPFQPRLMAQRNLLPQFAQAVLAGLQGGAQCTIGGFGNEGFEGAVEEGGKARVLP